MVWHKAAKCTNTVWKNILRIWKSRLWAASKNAAWNSSCLVSHHHRSHLPLIYMLSECNMESSVQMLIGSCTRFPFPWIADVSMLLLQWDCHESSSHWYWGGWKLHFHPPAFLLVGDKEKKKSVAHICDHLFSVWKVLHGHRDLMCATPPSNTTHYCKMSLSTSSDRGRTLNSYWTPPPPSGRSWSSSLWHLCSSSAAQIWTLVLGNSGYHPGLGRAQECLLLQV